MKRVGQLMEQITEPENLRLAFWKAARGKWKRPEVRAFSCDLGAEISRLRTGLLDGSYPVGVYHRFIVHDPKERVIHAAAFPERVLQHAIMNVCEPVFERLAVFDSYACRVGKGQWKAVARAETFAARYRFFLKMDIRKYFDSVSHRHLAGLLKQRFKDASLLAWFEKLLDCYETTPGCGLPIGSLTSQHLANFYLLPLDRFIKEILRFRGYVRYMDDCVVWGDSASELRSVQSQVEGFVWEQLELKLKDFPCVNRTALGMDFLGCRVYPGYSTLNHRSRCRFARKLRHYEQEQFSGEMGDREYQQRVAALLGFAAKPCSWRFRHRIMGTLGQRLEGLEPRDPRRQLEQQSAELPVRQSQQQRPVESQQQYRVPGCPSSDQSRMAQGTEPAVVPSATVGPEGGKREKPDCPVPVAGRRLAKTPGNPHQSISRVSSGLGLGGLSGIGWLALRSGSESVSVSKGMPSVLGMRNWMCPVRRLSVWAGSAGTARVCYSRGTGRVSSRPKRYRFRYRPRRRWESEAGSQPTRRRTKSPATAGSVSSSLSGISGRISNGGYR